MIRGTRIVIVGGVSLVSCENKTKERSQIRSLSYPRGCAVALMQKGAFAEHFLMVVKILSGQVGVSGRHT